MKKYRIIFSILLLVSILFTACEKTGSALPDGMENGVIATIHITDNSDGKIDLYNPDDVYLEFDVNVFDGDYSTLDLMVVKDGDYTNQYVIKSVNPGIVEITVADIISAVDVLSSSADITPGTLFNFFLNVNLESGQVLAGYLPTGKTTYGSNLQNHPDYNFNVNVLAANPYLPSDFVDYNYHVVETTLADGEVSEYDVYVEADPDNLDLGLKVWDLWWTSDAESDSYVILSVNPDNYAINGENQFIWYGNAWGVYGRIAFEDFRNGLINTASYTFTFITTPTLPDPGYWWGTEVLYELTRITPKKGLNDNTRNLPSNNLIKR